MNNDEAFAEPKFDGTRYKNPISFTSWKNPDWISVLSEKIDSSNVQELNRTLPVHEPQFQLDSPLSATWLGHATMHLRIDGISVLTDPVWARYASPAFFKFCQRFRPSPCSIDNLPEIHVVLISHNHYDHLDIVAVRRLAQRFPGIQWFVPKGLLQWTQRETGSQNVHELTWGESVPMQFNEEGSSFEIHSVPAQHWSQRSMFDRNKTLWCGWIIKGPRHKFFYTGDTGFCADEFRKLGDIHGPIDLSAIPIGAYEPRWFMSPQHIDPGEAVQIHQLAKSKKSLGVHWGTYEMGSSEGYLEPREKLAEAVAAAGLGPDEFVTLGHGQSWRVEG
ncbi:hypothetical protein GPALN_006330 [Globodera pallida]|nr:hypothetical protein GPALN_006330 [Globodera pallida]